MSDEPTDQDPKPTPTGEVKPWLYTPGNTVAAGNRGPLSHGGWSQRIVGPIAEAFVESVLSDPACGYLHAPKYRPALNAWAVAEARVMVLDEFMSGMSIAAAAASDRGRTSYLELSRRWDAAAMAHRSRLGLDPLSRARLGRDVAAEQVDVVQVLTAMRTAQEADAAAAKAQAKAQADRPDSTEPTP